MGGSKSAGAGKSYNYYGTIVGSIGIGPFKGLVAAIFDGKELWPGGSIWAVGASITLNSLWKFNHQTYQATTSPTGSWPYTASVLNQPGVGGYWTLYYFTRSVAEYDDFTIPGKGVMRIRWGDPSQTVDSYVNGNSYGEVHPPYNGIATVVLGPTAATSGPSGFLLGQDVSTAPNIELVMMREPNQSIVTGMSMDAFNVNLVCVQAELLTDPNGLGVPTAAIDATSFQAAANSNYAKRTLMYGSPLLDTQDTTQSFLDALRNMTDNYVRFNPSTKLIETGVYQHGVAPGSYVTLGNDDLAGMPQITSSGWVDVKSRAVVQFKDINYNFTQVSDKADDLRAYSVLGMVRAETLDRPWITRRDQARLHALETLRTIGRPPMTAKISVRREKARTIRAGDYVLLNITLEPSGTPLYQFFRVDQRSIPSSGPISLTITADNTLAPVPFNSPAVMALSPTDNLPLVSNLRVLSDDYGITGVDGAVIILAERPDMLALGFEAFFDTSDVTGTFTTLGTQRAWAARATLHASLLASATTVYVDVPGSAVDTSRFLLSPGDVAAANDDLLAIVVSASGGAGADIDEDAIGRGLVEVMSISASTLVSGSLYSLTVLRGRRNTYPIAWGTSGTEVWIIPRALAFPFTHAFFPVLRSNRLASLSPATGYFRLTPFTQTQELELADVTSTAFQMTKKAPDGPRCVIGPTITTAGQVTYTRIAHTATTLGFAVLTARDVNIGYFAAYMIPQGGTLDLNNPTLSFNIVTGATTGTGMATWALGATVYSTSVGVPAAYLGFGSGASIATPSDATRFQAIPLTIPAAGTYRLVVMAQDAFGLQSEVLAEMQIVAT